MSEVVSIPVSQLQQLQSRLAVMEANQASDAAARQAAEAGAAIARGESAAVVKAFQGKLAAAEEEARTNAATADLRKALAAHPLRDGYAVEHVTSLLADEITADRDSTGRLTTRSRDFRPIDAFVTERLSKPEFAHFLAPRNPSAPAAQPQPGSSAQPAPQQPGWQALANLAGMPLGVRVQIAALQKTEAATAAGTPLDARSDMSLGLGLGRRR
jgi:hypothetical protein